MRFHPAEYAVPESQYDRLLEIWIRHRGPRYPRESAVRMLWFNMGPAACPDEPPLEPS